MAAFAIDSTRERSRRAASERPQVPAFRRSLPNRRNEASREQLIQRIRAEFEELRGLKLTLAQARRLFGLREDVCQRVLNTLVRDGLLRLTPDKLFERRRIDISRPRRVEYLCRRFSSRDLEMFRPHGCSRVRQHPRALWSGP